MTAAALANRLGVSERTVYRDVSDLVASGVPIEGEAGVGYSLSEHFHLPPLMLTPDEVEALTLGARVVEEWADPELVAAARSVLEKVEAVLPEPLKRGAQQSRLFSVSFDSSDEVAQRLATLRGAVRDRRKVCFHYRRADGTESERTVEPICLVLMMSAWLLAAWCELRSDFRTFRLDRMGDLRLLDETFMDNSARGLTPFLRTVAIQRRGRRSH